MFIPSCNYLLAASIVDGNTETRVSGSYCLFPVWQAHVLSQTPRWAMSVLWPLSPYPRAVILARGGVCAGCSCLSWSCGALHTHFVHHHNWQRQSCTLAASLASLLTACFSGEAWLYVLLNKSKMRIESERAVVSKRFNQTFFKWRVWDVTFIFYGITRARQIRISTVPSLKIEICHWSQSDG